MEKIFLFENLLALKGEEKLVVIPPPPDHLHENIKAMYCSCQTEGT